MIRKSTLLGFAAAITLMGSVAASAATVTFGSIAGITPIANPVGVNTGTVLDNTTGSIANTKKSPWTGADATTGLYTAVLGGGTATYSFAGPRNTLSFVWGSPDLFNTVEFLLGTSVVDSVVLTAVQNITPATLGGASALATFNNITSTGGLFDGVRILSSVNAFEYGNLTATAIPLPAGGLLLISGIAALAAARRRKAA